MRLRILPLSMLVLSLVALPRAAPSSEQAQMRGTGTISGHVTMGGRPVPDVAVTIAPLLPATRWPDVSATTDEQGNYTLADVPAGAWRVAPVAAGYMMRGDLEYQKVTLGDGEAVTGINFELVPAGKISGRVLTNQGDPIAGAKVYLLKLTEAHKVVPNRIIPVRDTNRSGEYEFNAVQEGSYWIEARPWPAGDSIEAAREFFSPGGTTSAEARVLEIVPGAVLMAVDVSCGPVARPGVVASGRVVDAISRAPVAGMRLVYGMFDERPAVSAVWSDVRTDAEGRFVLRGLKPGKGWVGLLPGESGELYSRPAIFDVGSPEGTNIEVLAEHGVSLTGRVVFSGGRPLDPEKPEDRFFVGLFPRDITRGAFAVIGAGLDSTFYKEVRTAPDGTFLLKGLPPGEGTLSIKRVMNQLSDDFAVRIVRKGVDVAGGRLTVSEDTGDITIVMTSGGGAIRGSVKVLDGTLRPSRLEVWATLVNSAFGSLTRKAVVNPDGWFAMDQLPAGEYQVMVIQHLENGTTRRTGDVRRVVLAKGEAVDLELPIEPRALRQ